MVGWHHLLNGHAFEQALGDGEGQGSLVCCSPWGHKESDMTERLNKSLMQFLKLIILKKSEISSFILHLQTILTLNSFFMLGPHAHLSTNYSGQEERMEQLAGSGYMPICP